MMLFSIGSKTCSPPAVLMMAAPQRGRTGKKKGSIDGRTEEGKSKTHLLLSLPLW